MPVLLWLAFGGWLLGLSSPDWRARDRASAALARGGPAAILAAWLYDPPDAEAAWRRAELVGRCGVRVEDVAAALYVCRPGPGWCDPAGAEWFTRADRWLAFDRLGRLADAYPAHGSGPWGPAYEWCGLDDRERVRAAGNYLRSRVLGRPIPWAWTWQQCVDPPAGEDAGPDHNGG